MNIRDYAMKRVHWLFTCTFVAPPIGRAQNTLAAELFRLMAAMSCFFVKYKFVFQSYWYLNIGAMAQGSTHWNL